MTTRRRARWQRWLGVALFNVAVVVAVLYAFFLHWRRAYSPRAPFRMDALAASAGIPIGLLHAIGDYRADARRNLAVPFAHPGTLRIGAFGDSYTWGDEVAPGYDYPSILQRLFREQGYPQVEVMNFGSSWQGLGQAMRIWEELGPRYGIDTVLLGPACIHLIGRDLTFNHGERFVPHYLHGRWVLDGDSVRFLDVIGPPDAEARHDEYFRFIPHWRYLRYDRHAPPFLRALLPEGKQIANPFYYTSLSAVEEADRLDRALFHRLVASGTQVVLLHKDEHVISLGDELPIAGVIPNPVGFLYHRPREHLSGLGNELVARSFFAALTGAPIRQTRLRLSDPPPDATGSPPALDSFQSIELQLEGHRVGAFDRMRPDGAEEDPSVTGLRAAGIKSLLALAPPGTAAIDRCMLGLEAPLHAGMRVELSWDEPAGPRRKPLGTVRMLTGRLPIGVVEVDAIEPQYPEVHNVKFMTDVLRPGTIDPRSLASARILLDGNPIYRFEVADDGGASLVPLTTPVFFAIAFGDVNLDVARLPATGTIDLVADGTRVPIAAFAKEVIELPYRRSASAKPIQRPAAR